MLGKSNPDPFKRRDVLQRSLIAAWTIAAVSVLGCIITGVMMHQVRNTPYCGSTLAWNTDCVYVNSATVQTVQRSDFPHRVTATMTVDVPTTKIGLVFSGRWFASSTMTDSLQPDSKITVLTYGSQVQKIITPSGSYLAGTVVTTRFAHAFWTFLAYIALAWLIMLRFRRLQPSRSTAERGRRWIVITTGILGVVPPVFAMLTTRSLFPSPLVSLVGVLVLVFLWLTMQHRQQRKQVL